jgi:hypothetical protein
MRVALYTILLSAIAVFGLGGTRFALGNNGAIHSFANTQFHGGPSNTHATMFDAVRIAPFFDSSICASDTADALITYSVILPVHPAKDSFDDNEICGSDLADCCAGVPFCDLVEACLDGGHPNEVCCFDADCIDSVPEVKASLSYYDVSFTIDGELPQMVYRHPQSGAVKSEYRILSNFDEVVPACDAVYAEHGIPRPKNGQCFSFTSSAETGRLLPGEYSIHTEAPGDIFGPYDATLTVEDC